MTDDPSPPRLRKRVLSGEEKRLWQEVAKSAKPLRRRRPVVAAEVVEGAAQVPSRPVAKKIAREIAPPAIAKPARQPLVSIDRRERSRIAKGRKQIDARIDLHGMTQARAHRALTAFLYRAHGDGAALVLVITGKGQPSAMGEERGVLRRQLPLWLALPELRNLVLGFDAAHAAHGGDGAFYVRLRRFRDD